MATKEKIVPTDVIPPLAREVRDAMNPRTGVVCKIDGASASASVCYATALCLEKKIVDFFDKKIVPPEIVEKLGSARDAEKRISDSKKQILTTVRMLGTHGGKFPDARLELGALMPDSRVSAATSRLNGVHTGTVRSGHPMSGAGNAGNSPQLKFLCTTFSYEGEHPESLIEILSKDSVARDSILRGFGQDCQRDLLDIGEAYLRRLDGKDSIPSNVNVYRSQVFFPVDGGYVSLSPLYPYSVGAELASRLQKRCWNEDAAKREYIDVRVVHVGGTKPQNGGFLANALGGRFPRLVAMPPEHVSSEWKGAVRAFMTDGLSIVGASVSADSVEEFRSASFAFDMKPNDKTRNLVEQALESMCVDVLANLDIVSRENEIALAKTGKPLLDPDKIPSKSRDIALVLGMSGHPVDDDDINRIARDVALKVAARLEGRTLRLKSGQKKITVDDAMYDTIFNAACERLRGSF